MDTIIICIDRDNDLGEKAQVPTPVIGRGANVVAAVNLGTADPEDSDTNTIFGGIKILDKLRSQGVDAEIVTFAGDKNIGVVSDRKIVEQLDSFLEIYEIKSAIFVSDGAEDEALIPIIQSRIKIDSVKRIIVMQNENLESTYYIIKNVLRDPKFLQTVFVPIGLALIIYAIAILADYQEGAITATLLVIGIYMILRAFGFDDTINTLFSQIQNSITGRKITIVTFVASALTFIIGTAIASIDTWALISENGFWYYGFLPLASLFVKKSVGWYTLSILLIELGSIIDAHRMKQSYLNNLTEIMFTLSISVIIWAATSYVTSVLIPGYGSDFPVAFFIYSIAISIFLGIFAIYFGLAADAHEKREREKRKEKIIWKTYHTDLITVIDDDDEEHDYEEEYDEDNEEYDEDKEEYEGNYNEEEEEYDEEEYNEEEFEFEEDYDEESYKNKEDENENINISIINRK